MGQGSEDQSVRQEPMDGTDEVLKIWSGLQYQKKNVKFPLQWILRSF